VLTGQVNACKEGRALSVPVPRVVWLKVSVHVAMYGSEGPELVTPQQSCDSCAKSPARQGRVGFIINTWQCTLLPQKQLRSCRLNHHL
jgi:hypothetical protein